MIVFTYYLQGIGCLLLGVFTLVCAYCSFKKVNDDDNFFLVAIILTIIGAFIIYAGYMKLWSKLDDEQLKFISENYSNINYKNCKDLIDNDEYLNQSDFVIYKSCIERTDYLISIDKAKSGKL